MNASEICYLCIEKSVLLSDSSYASKHKHTRAHTHSPESYLLQSILLAGYVSYFSILLAQVAKKTISVSVQWIEKKKIVVWRERLQLQMSAETGKE